MSLVQSLEKENTQVRRIRTMFGFVLPFSSLDFFLGKGFNTFRIAFSMEPSHYRVEWSVQLYVFG